MNYGTSSEMRSAPLERSINCPAALSTTVELLSAVSITRPDAGRRRLAAARPLTPPQSTQSAAAAALNYLGRLSINTSVIPICTGGGRCTVTDAEAEKVI